MPLVIVALVLVWLAFMWFTHPRNGAPEDQMVIERRKLSATAGSSADNESRW